jgi:hypothetical protein
MQWRLTNDVASASLADASRPRPSPIPNAWLRITRTNQSFTFHYGTNGTHWSTLYTADETVTPYPETAYVGLATTSHNNTSGLANTVGAYYRDLTGLPLASVEQSTLSIQMLSPTQLAISWTSTDPTLQLQYTESLAPTSWQSAGSATQNGDTFTVTVTLTAQPRFYRLIK